MRLIDADELKEELRERLRFYYVHNDALCPGIFRAIEIVEEEAKKIQWRLMDFEVNRCGQDNQ